MIFANSTGQRGGLELGKHSQWRKQVFNYSTRSGNSASELDPAGKFVFLTFEAKMPLSGLTLRGAELLTS